jgi:U32 family peptidase
MAGKPINRASVEVMAPAGTFESLRAAIAGGADAVYFGVEHLNMRSKSARNFLTSDLPLIVRYCRFCRVKSYLALNTIIYDQELQLARQVIDAAAEAGISAIIASDQSVLEYALKRGVHLHLSTQLNISNVETVKFYARYADVMVLARELTLDQISNIAAQISLQGITGPSGNPVRLELFVHGALCMAVSGKCYLSLHQYNTSANRGNCLQACRRAYRVEDVETGDQLEIDQEFIMSPKDLSTIHFLDRILAAGITVLKIEGRARPAEYVKTVTECYGEAVESIFSGTFGPDKIVAWNDRLATVFNRGFWDGYYLGQRLGEWSGLYGSAATRRKILIGIATNFYTKLNVSEFEIRSESLSAGDEVLIIGPTTGLIQQIVKEMRDDHGPVETAAKGRLVAFRTGRKVRRGDKLYKWVMREASADIVTVSDTDDVPG